MRDARPFAREVADRQVAMFAMFVGTGRTVTRAALAAASGIPEGTLRTYAEGAAMPLHNALMLAQHLPPAAIDMLTEPGGMRLVPKERAAADWDDLAVDLSGLVFEICDARSDGRIDHVESARLRANGRGIAAKLTRLAEDE